MGIHPANAVGDDIEAARVHVRSHRAAVSCKVYRSEDRDTVKCKFYGLRQQLDMGESTYWCQGDFIAPKDCRAKLVAVTSQASVCLLQTVYCCQGYSDYISAFACTGGIGCHEQRQKFEEKGEIDQAILLEAVNMPG